MSMVHSTDTFPVQLFIVAAKRASSELSLACSEISWPSFILLFGKEYYRNHRHLLLCASTLFHWIDFVVSKTTIHNAQASLPMPSSSSRAAGAAAVAVAVTTTAVSLSMAPCDLLAPISTRPKPVYFRQRMGC